MNHVLRIAGPHFAQLRAHLFPGDGKEAVALLLCGVHSGENSVLCSQSVFLVPHAACTIRAPDLLSWPTMVAMPVFIRAQSENLVVVKVHSHPTGVTEFSVQDDHSDLELLSSLAGWTTKGLMHGSAVMLPDGSLFGRVLTEGAEFKPINRIAVVNHDLQFFEHDRSRTRMRESDQRTSQAFGPGTVDLLKRLTIGVAGCSGTGSWVIEMLGRLGVGRLVLIDPEQIEAKNLNRIVGSTIHDAQAGAAKVNVMRRSVEAMGFGSIVIPIQSDLSSSAAILALAGCDVVFGCLDSSDGRDILNRISSAYCIPLFDVGVRLNANGQGGIDYVGGAVHYVQPGGSSLLSRRVITSEGISADELRRRNPAEFERRRKEGYIHGAVVDSPAVTSVNGFHAAMAVNEFLARIHPYRLRENSEIDAVLSNVTGAYLELESSPTPCGVYAPLLGRGDKQPILGLIGQCP